jgi:copper chaperone
MKLVVEGMTCGHCVRTITTAIQKLDSSALVDIDLSTGHVGICSNGVSTKAATQAIQNEGYAVVAILDGEPDASEKAVKKSCCGTCHA